jgi:hypothetical protein
LFERSALKLQSLIEAAVPDAKVYGHARSKWAPLPLDEPAKPLKGAFFVSVRGVKKSKINKQMNA